MTNLFNPKLGYYTVGGQSVASKIDACVMGTQQNVHPQWHFNDSVWNKLDWTLEPETDISELYRMRARQIREQYDYVIINYSGGSDSQTVVDSFLSAGCHIDEIATVWARSRTKKIVTEPTATDPKNIEAEFDLTTRPGLEKIRNASPTTKITYLDIGDATVDQFCQNDGAEWLKNTVEHLNPQYITRWSSTREKTQKVNLDRGLKTAVVYGVDKPRVCINRDRYCVYFVDVIPNSFRGGFNDANYTNLDTVFFYWQPDLPEIVVKQAHMIMQWFEKNPALKPILTWPNADYTKRQAYEIIARSIVYPDWNLGTFQCNKTTSPIYCEWDHWFFQEYQGTAVYDRWAEGIEYVKNNIDRKYLNYTFDDRFDGLIGMINGHFYLQN